MNKYDTSQLTEFPRFEPESTQSGVTTFFTKLWKFPIFSPNDATEGETRSSGDNKQSASQPEKQGKEEQDDIKTETGTYAVEFEGRSLPNVLKRISSLVALGSGGGTRYADTELARYWMPDDISRECYECAARFSALRRRHHCRVCGQIFCSRCCSQRVPGQIFGCAGGLRVCNYCCNVVLSYLRENDMSGDISPDLRTLQEALQMKFPDNKSSLSAAASREFLFLHEAEEREARGSPREPPHDLFRRLAQALPTQQHRYRLVRYNGVWRGCDIMQWIMDNTNNKTRAQATLVCEELICAGYMECATEMVQFADYALYRPLVIPMSSTCEEDEPEECNRLVESVSTYCLDLNLGDSSARLTKASKTETKSSPSSEEDNPTLEHSEGYPEARSVCRAIEQSGAEHLRLLLRQCLARAALPAAWLDALYPLCISAADTIAPDIHSKDMDVRNYVQIKKVPGGDPRDSCLVPGVVLAKNVAHRGMPQQISNPTVLLLDCSITYQRVEGKLTSLEPVLMQEQEYLVRCAARITALRPKVVLVRGSVARGVQDALRAQGVALATGVREHALRRAARCAHADLVTSIDARIGMPRLGTCKNFYVSDYSGKTLMVLEGCAEPHLGCCILLRGASIQELIRVKKIVKFMLLACYNWKLEKAFLGDIEAVLPEPGMTFADDDDNDKNIVAKDKIDTTKDITNDNDEANDIFGNSSEVIDNDNVNFEDMKSNDSLKTNDDINTIDDGIVFNDTELNAKLSTDDFAKSDETSIKGDEKFDDIGMSSETVDGSCLTKVEEIDDPLQKARFSRKTDSDKNLSCGVPIRDFSDPLRATFSEDDDVFLPKEETELKADDTHSDRWSTDDVVLSMSPNIVIPSPWAPATPRAPRRRSTPRISRPICKAAAPFVEQAIAQSADDPKLRAALALFRATGCRLLTGPHKRDCPLYTPSVVKKVSKESEMGNNEKQNETIEPLDPLAPENHQRLSLLLYSYSSKSANEPDFCVNPWIVTMEMYGRNDISLGAFLHKYCFSGEQRCPSSACLVPMNQHVRKFVHDDVCITITCNTIGHSSADKQPSDERGKQVRFWSRCERCGVSGHGATLSRAALALSLAQYLRLRCAAPRYAPAAPCPHPLHRHAHAFVCGLTTACFRYSKISTYDVELPPEVIAIKYEPKQMRDALIAQLNELMLKGHETFSSVADGEAEKEYQAFRQHMDRIHLALTSASLQNETSLAGVVRALWDVSDQLVGAERMLRDAHERWPAQHADRKHHDSHVEEKSDLEESSGEGANNDSTGTTYVFASDNNSKDADKEHTGTEEDEEKGDKKTVRQILSQLLSNNQSTNQGSIIISSGVVPVVVRAGDVGSVIAATLASATYQRSLRLAALSTQSEQDENENSMSKEKSEADKQKAAKANEHIEVLLKEGLSCRVYYAAAFRRLRHMLLAGLARRVACPCDAAHDKDVKSLCEIEECFLRSLAHSEPWATRGGKSGSTFCKTVDDRYVLKEMTKPEWQQFLEFAPHYFNYVTSCHQNKQPSLLARIVGVYSVGGSGSGVLVTEHVWHACPPHAPRFDLKGTARTAPPGARGALADAELLRLRWERPLHVRGAEWRAVWACAERDTQFLAEHAVMDYSLLLAVDREDDAHAQRGGRLVLGIIDYIRTFTWDKKLEHLVKKNLGSGQPTVVSPAQYRSRLLAACRNYFLHCPSHWDHLIGSRT